MEEHPILPLFGYLLQKGCSWEAVNNAGKKAADILREKGYPNDVIKVLDRTAVDAVFNWIDDGSEQGYIEDRFGAKYTWIGRNRKDGSVGYRCDKTAASSQFKRKKNTMCRKIIFISQKKYNTKNMNIRIVHFIIK